MRGCPIDEVFAEFDSAIELEKKKKYFPVLF